ncbi:hypothetical protein T265_11354 [Opisthorchis viverrini]|uniref:Uncharacterized protein n=1 Tax=Opisthorchis viverrini TaxID=6198 RepID=A0A074Z9T5_OPIVI|nr:hypothetical protein T265_11354 [Opisthorchis viverrini]KER20005.1 hypothetical protein T265_11354 [Opisthorchis viverrini]
MVDIHIRLDMVYPETHGCRVHQLAGERWLNGEITNLTEEHGSNPTPAFHLPPSRRGQLGSILAHVLPSGEVTARHQKAGERWLNGEITNLTEEHGSNPTPAFHLPPSRRGQLGSILAHVLPSGELLHFCQLSPCKNNVNSSAASPLRLLTATSPEGCTRAGIVPSFPSLDRGSIEQSLGSNHGPSGRNCGQLVLLSADDLKSWSSNASAPQMDVDAAKQWSLD